MKSKDKEFADRCDPRNQFEWEEAADAPESMVSQKLHRSVVLRLTAERDAARREAAGLQERIAALRAQVRELKSEVLHARAEGVASGRVAAIVEAVDLLEDRLGKMVDRPARGTTLWAIELIKGIKS